MADTIKIALYGKYGTRKTLQIKRLIETYGADKVLIVSAEHGLNTIGDSADPQRTYIVDNLKDLRAAYDACSTKAASTDYWVCVDGMSRIMQLVANEQLSGADKYFEGISRGETHEGMPESLKPFGRYMTERGKMDTMRIYGRIGRDSENLLSAWIRLKCNLYCNYLEDQSSNGTDKGPPYVPDVPGNVGLKAVMSSFDFVMRLSYDSDGQLVAGLDPASRLYLARTREDRSRVKLEKTIEDFNLAVFTKKLAGGA